MELDGQRVLIVGLRDGKAAAPGRVVKAAHVPADGHRFLHFQFHEPLNEENALLAVAVGEQILHAVGGHFFPLAGHVIFHVAGAALVVVGLAQVVQQGADGKALLAVALGEERVMEGVIDVEAVHTQPALTGPVEPGGGRSREEIGLVVQPVQQLLAAGAGDMLLEDLQKLLAVAHLTAPYRPGCP